jgi:hypothetical protein
MRKKTSLLLLMLILGIPLSILIGLSKATDTAGVGPIKGAPNLVDVTIQLTKPVIQSTQNTTISIKITVINSHYWAYYNMTSLYGLTVYIDGQQFYGDYPTSLNNINENYTAIWDVTLYGLPTNATTISVAIAAHFTYIGYGLPDYMPKSLADGSGTSNVVMLSLDNSSSPSPTQSFETVMPTIGPSQSLPLSPTPNTETALPTNSSMPFPNSTFTEIETPIPSPTIPEFPSTILAITFLAVTVLVGVFSRRKQLRRNQDYSNFNFILH